MYSLLCPGLVSYTGTNDDMIHYYILLDGLVVYYGISNTIVLEIP